MNDLNFDIYALVKPKTKEDFLAVLNEAFAIITEINETLERIFPEEKS